MKDTYAKQVMLLLEILPDVAEEKNFALHGGTAINLFHLNMPRVSVDRDKEFLLSFVKGEPSWDDADYSMFPAVKWKLHHINKLKVENPQKYQRQIELLQQSFLI